MKTNLDTKRITIYLVITFGLAWLVSLVVYLTGGLNDSPTLFTIQGAPITLALILIAILVMWSPAIGNILTRLITKEGWKNNYLRPHIKRSWAYWLAAWFLPGILTLIGMALFFLISPNNFDPELSTIQELLEANGQGLECGCGKEALFNCLFCLSFLL